VKPADWLKVAALVALFALGGVLEDTPTPDPIRTTTTTTSAGEIAR
jgi:hypothetical protein